MSNVTTTLKDGVAVIALDDGKANALGAQMWADLNANGPRGHDVGWV